MRSSTRTTCCLACILRDFGRANVTKMWWNTSPRLEGKRRWRRGCQLSRSQHGTPSLEKQCCNCRPAPQGTDVDSGGTQNLWHDVSVLKSAQKSSLLATVISHRGLKKFHQGTRPMASKAHPSSKGARVLLGRQWPLSREQLQLQFAVLEPAEKANTLGELCWWLGPSQESECGLWPPVHPTSHEIRAIALRVLLWSSNKDLHARIGNRSRAPLVNNRVDCRIYSVHTALDRGGGDEDQHYQDCFDSDRPL